MSASSTAPTLIDGDVIIRAHRSEDATGAYEQSQDPRSQRWTTVPVPYSQDDAAAFVGELMPKGWADDSEWGFAVERDGRYGGTISLRSEGNGRAELACGSHPSIRGTGAMERALRLLLDWGFETQGLHTVIWWAHQGNWAARKLAWRLGFTVEGTVRRWQPQRGELRDSWVGTLLRDDDRKPKGAWLKTPVLSGATVTLRPLRETDIPRIVEACSDARTAQWLGGMPAPYVPTDAIGWLEANNEGSAAGSKITWAVVDPRSDQLLGAINLFDLVSEQEGEVGYWAHPDARGRGVMTAACGLVLRHGFEDLGLRIISAIAAVDNAASRRVIEQCGFTLWGIQRGGVQVRTGYVDAARYDVLAEEFRSRR